MKTIDRYYLFYILSLIILPLGLLIRLLFSHTISIEEFGMIYATISFFIVISILSKEGFSLALKYYIPKYKSKQKIVNIFYYNLGINLISLVLFTILLLIFSSYLINYYFKSPDLSSIFYIFIIYFWSLNLLNLQTDIFLAFKLRNYFQFAKIIELSLILVLSFIIVYLNFSELAIYFSIIWSLSTLITMFIFSYFLFREFPYLLSRPKFDRKQIKEYFSQVFPMYNTEIPNIILDKTDIFIITFFLTLTSVAFYSNAFAIVSIFSIFLASISFIILPLVSELVSKKKFKQIHNILNLIYGLFLFIILPLSLILSFYSTQIIILIFGDSFIPAGYILSIFSVFLVFKVLMMFNIQITSGLGKAKNLSKLVFIVALLNLVLNLILIQFFDLIGVIIATVLSWIIITIFTFRIIKKEIDYMLDKIKLIKILFLGFIFYVSFQFLESFISIENISFLALITTLTLLMIYLIIGYFVGIFTIKEIITFSPSKVKPYLIKIHKKYFHFLK